MTAPIFTMWATCEMCDAESSDVTHCRGDGVGQYGDLVNLCTDCADFMRRMGTAVRYVDER
jgi:hypothetical protein